MTVLDAFARLRAHHEGRPIPTGAALAFARAHPENQLVLTFVRMGGESLPWGIAYGHPGEEPTVLTVPEPRNRELVAAMCAKLAPALDVHLAHPSVAGELDVHDLPVDAQLWLPNASHVQMLDLRYTRARRGDADRIARLNRLGRAAGFLFRESCRPGQLAVIDAAAALKQHWAVPAEDVRQAHLGFALAWHQAGDAATRRAAARTAEKRSVGITLDPDVENDDLAPLVERWNAAEGESEKDRVHAQIHAVLEIELRRRFDLTVQATARIADDPRPENPELDALRAIARDELDEWWGAEAKLLRGESAFVHDPETDRHPPGAAKRFFIHEGANEEVAGSLVHGDDDRLRRLIESGDALEGRIVEVENRGTNRRKEPVWTIVSAAHTPLRLRAGSKACVVGHRKRVVRVLSVRVAGGVRLVEVEVVVGKRRCHDPAQPAAHDAGALEGTQARLVKCASGALSKRKSFGVWKADGPGAWLTHAAPAPVATRSGAPPADLLTLVESLKG